MMQDPPAAEKLVRLRTVADVDAITPGKKFHLAVIFDIEPHWHIYWLNSGASGAPTEVNITAPEGFTVGTTQFPRPQVFEEEMIGTTFGYADQTVLFVPITVPPPDVIESESALFTIDVQYLVCKRVCLFGSKKLTLTMPVRSDPANKVGETTSSNPIDAKLLRTFQDQLPQPLRKLRGAEARFERGELVITGPADGFKEVTLFPLLHPGVSIDDVHTETAGDKFRIRARVTVEPQNALGKPMAIEGVIGLGEKRTDPAYQFIIPLDERGNVKQINSDPAKGNGP